MQDVNKELLVCLCTISLLIAGVIGLKFFPRKASALGDGIIVIDADYVWTNTTEYSADLINVTRNVTPRMIMEYGDYNSKLNLNKSDELNQVANVVSSRITVEYTDFMATYGLDESENLTQTATTVTPRIIVEYADFLFSTDLGPKPLEDDTPPVIQNVYQQPPSDSVYPDDEVIVYANVTDDVSGVKQVVLNFTTNNGTWFSRQMTNLEDTIYNATIREFPYCTNVTYAIMAEDNANNIVTTDIGHEYKYHVIPEFPSFIIVPLFLIATLLASIIQRRKHKKSV